MKITSNSLGLPVLSIYWVVMGKVSSKDQRSEQPRKIYWSVSKILPNLTKFFYFILLQVSLSECQMIIKFHILRTTMVTYKTVVVLVQKKSLDIDLPIATNIQSMHESSNWTYWINALVHQLCIQLFQGNS